MELTELQFTEEEIDHGVKALAELQLEQEGAVSVHADQIRAVLRAVRALPARCLNGSLAGVPAAVGAPVQGVGLGGVQVAGWVIWSYPVTTSLRTADGAEAYVWTNTLASWDPTTGDAVVSGSPGTVIGPLRTGKSRFAVDLNLEARRQAAEIELGMPVVFDNTLPPGVAYVVPREHLTADDDGMPVEGTR